VIEVFAWLVSAGRLTWKYHGRTVNGVDCANPVHGVCQHQQRPADEYQFKQRQHQRRIGQLQLAQRQLKQHRVEQRVSVENPKNVSSNNLDPNNGDLNTINLNDVMNDFDWSLDWDNFDWNA
jgi:hypothetical protein